MKKTVWALAAGLLLSLFSGCAAKAPARPLREVPTLTEYNEYVVAHPEEAAAYRGEVMDLLDAMSDEELRAAVEDELTAWADKNEPGAFDRVGFSFSRDELLINNSINARTYANLTAEIGVYYDRARYSVADENAMMDRVSGEISDLMEQSLYALMKFDTFQIVGYSGAERRYESPVANMGLGPSARLSDGELRAQTIAFDDVAAFNAEDFSDPRYNPHGEVRLRRFGVLPGTEELYIEIAIDTVGYREGAERDAFTARLEERSRALFERMGADAEAADWMAEQGVRTVKVSFDTPWEKQGRYYYSYSYAVAS